jgi:drug/metabolite transporter (DMT)-like permease
MGVSRVRLVLSLSLGVVAISSASILIRFAQAEAPTLTIAAWRLTIASLVLLPYAWLTCRPELRRLSRQEWRYLLISGGFLGLHFAAWISSLGYTSVASSVVLVSMGPLFVGFGSWLFLRERLVRATLLGILLAALGSLLVGWSDLGQGQDQLWGDVLALLGAVMIAGYLMIGRKVRSRLSLVAYIAPVYGAAMVCLWLLVAVARPQLVGFSAATYGWIAALALVPQLIGHSTLNWALAHLSATFVSLLTLVEPVGSGVLAYLILGEAVTYVAAAGGGLILAGIYIASRAEARLASSYQAKEAPS